MKFEMAKNSLFAVLLRKPWWISAGIAVAMALLALALLPEAYRIGGALSGFPFVIIAVMAARAQWQRPSAARIEETQKALAAMSWTEFSSLLEQCFRRDGYTVQAGNGAPVDLTLERQGRRTLVSARRWKSARTGLEPLRALQAAREASDVWPDALCVSLGELTETARPFAAEQRIVIWQAAELAQALRGLLARPPIGPRR